MGALRSYNGGMTAPDALEGFLDKWRARWPEWPVAETFVPPVQRATAVAWFALLQEFEDAMNIAGDPLPADAKLAWWGEELRDWSRRRSRHPLGRVLEPLQAPWRELADVLPVLIEARAQPADEAAAFARWVPFAQALVAVEDAVFAEAGAGATRQGETSASPVGPATTPIQPQPQAQARIEAVAAQWLAARLMGAGAAATPMAPAMAPAVWVERLQWRWPARITAAPVPGRLRLALARARLRGFRGADAGVPPLSPLRTLWLGWRAARG